MLFTRTKKEHCFDAIIFTFPILFTLVCVILYQVFKPTYDFLFYAGNFFLTIKFFYSFLIIVSAFLCLLISIRLRKLSCFIHSIIYMLFFIILCLLFFELIHWGQIIFDFKTFFLKADQLIENQMAVHELVRLRFYFESVPSFLGLYSSFFWILFINKKDTLKNTTARLLVPDATLMLYFVPAIGALFISLYIIYVVSHSEMNAPLIKSFSWLFTLQICSVHYCRTILSLGIVIFFIRNFIWIKNSKEIRDTDAKHHFISISAFLLCFLLYVFIFVSVSNSYAKYHFMGLGKFLAMKNQFHSALEQYTAVIKMNDDDRYVHKELFLLYHRIGNNEAAVRHLSEALKMSMASGDEEMFTKLCQATLTLYPNTVIDPSTKTIYLNK